LTCFLPAWLLQDLSVKTAIKVEDVQNTLQQLGMMQYQKGQHVICAAPAVIEKHLKAVSPRPVLFKDWHCTHFPDT
jgi:septum formation inhibitor-activating ATPase MinD